MSNQIEYNLNDNRVEFDIRIAYQDKPYYDKICFNYNALTFTYLHTYTYIYIYYTNIYMHLCTCVEMEINARTINLPT